MASPDEIVPWTELKQRNFSLQTPGLTFVMWNESKEPEGDGEWCSDSHACPKSLDGDGSHPITFETAFQAKAACERAQRKGFYFLRKLVGTADTSRAIAACALGISNLDAAPKSWPPPPLLHSSTVLLVCSSTVLLLFVLRSVAMRCQ